MKHVWYKLKWYLNNVITFFGENKNSNADKTVFQKKRDEISQHERKKKSFMIFIEMTLTL